MILLSGISQLSFVKLVFILLRNTYSIEDLIKFESAPPPFGLVECLVLLLDSTEPVFLLPIYFLPPSVLFETPHPQQQLSHRSYFNILGHLSKSLYPHLITFSSILAQAEEDVCALSSGRIIFLLGNGL